VSWYAGKEDPIAMDSVSYIADWRPEVEIDERLVDVQLHKW
jgi:hypothetical protein